MFSAVFENRWPGFDFCLHFYLPGKEEGPCVWLTGYVSFHCCWERIACLGTRCLKMLLFCFLFLGAHWADFSSSSLGYPGGCSARRCTEREREKGPGPAHSPWLSFLWNVFSSAHFVCVCGGAYILSLCLRHELNAISRNHPFMTRKLQGSSGNH